MIGLDRYDVDGAVERVAPFADVTPVIRAHRLESRRPGTVSLKAENLQRTGSFKVRGAANFLSRLTAPGRQVGAVTCSSGNHGKAVAYVGQRLGIPTTICVPEWVDPVKASAMEQAGATIVRFGRTFDEAERRSFELRADNGLVYVSAFDDEHIIAGQGTIGVELVEQIPDLDTVLVPLSGGGLIAGIAIALRSRSKARVVAVSAANARVMYESQLAGRPVTMEEEETLATALAGGIGPDNAHTFGLVGELVDQHVLVTEDEVAAAMAFAGSEHKLILEGGGATALAGMLFHGDEVDGQSVAVVLSGGNIDLQRWTDVVTPHLPLRA